METINEDIIYNLSKKYGVAGGYIKSRKKDDELLPIVYFKNTTEVSRPENKSILLKHKCKYLAAVKVWAWWATNSLYKLKESYITPCLMDLYKKEIHNTDNFIENLISDIDKVLYTIENKDIPVLNPYTQDEIDKKLLEFKQKLISAVSAEEFKALLGPIIKFKNAMGHQFSMINTILIWMQRPDAIMVKSRYNWNSINREVKSDAIGIWLWMPQSNGYYTKEEKGKITDEYLKRLRKPNIESLSIREKEELNILLRKSSNVSFILKNAFYDYKDTYQMEGKEDIVGDPSTDNIPWNDYDTEETEKSIQYVDSMLRFIRSYNITVRFVPDLGGALGVSKSGTIEVLSSAPKNPGLLNTLIHEFSHEMLHQIYLKTTNDEMKGYFVGTEKGRGIVEQQAELSAWIVMLYLGYDMPTNINYVGIWGMNEKNAVIVFDSVAKTADRIYKGIISNLTITEGKKYNILNEETILNGYDVAKMLGFGELYLKSKEYNELEHNQENELEDDSMLESFRHILNNL